MSFTTRPPAKVDVAEFWTRRVPATASSVPGVEVPMPMKPEFASTTRYTSFPVVEPTVKSALSRGLVVPTAKAPETVEEAEEESTVRGPWMETEEEAPRCPSTLSAAFTVEEAEVMMPTEVVGVSASAAAVSWRVSFPLVRFCVTVRDPGMSTGSVVVVVRFPEASMLQVSFCRVSPPVKAPVRPERSEEKVAMPFTANVEEAESGPPTSRSEAKVEEAREMRPTEVVGVSASAAAVSWRVSFCREAPPVKEAVRPLRSEPKVTAPSTARVEEAPSEEETSRVPFTVEEALVTNPSGKFHAKPVVDAWK